MKLVTFELNTIAGIVRRVGALQNEMVVDINAAYSSYLWEVRGIWGWRELAFAVIPLDMLGFIENGVVATEAAQLALDHVKGRKDKETGPGGERIFFRLNDVKLKAPVPRPLSIRDCLTFEQHAKSGWARRGLELPKLWYEIPIHYRTTHTNVCGPNDPILWPSYSEKLDYELEIAVCIGKYGKNISSDRAAGYIAGYTIFNDISARDIQAKEMELRLGPSKGKNFENANIMGPCLVTPDELDVNNLRMMARINNEVWSDGNSRDMYFKFPDLIAYLSKDEPIYPGEFICSGTVGSGCGLEHGKWLKPGDVVELEIEGIGILRNKVERRG
jgi:2-keto-4-pentenoate hydratase/2-oxohepta-3-ene-1,7-dioic acid hydratase in catechol pathway